MLSPEDRYDRERAEERHRRRLMLMRMEGDIHKQEARAHRLIILAVALIVLAIIGVGLTQ